MWLKLFQYAALLCQSSIITKHINRGRLKSETHMLLKKLCCGYTDPSY
jgi:hypothetical protein